MKREDSRKPEQLRRINIQRNYLKHAEGSCLIELGNTRLVCAATLDKNLPLFLRNSGQGWVTAEYRMLPRSTPNRILRERVSGRNMEIQRLIGRSLRSIIDLTKLGEKTVWIDCDVIQANGGTRTAAVIGGFVALVDCVYKLYRQKVISEMCITGFLGAVSVGIWQGIKLLDLTYLEDSQAEVDMNIVMKSPEELVEIQGTAEQGSFSLKDLNELLGLAKKGVREIIDLEKSLFGDIIQVL